GGVEAGGWRRGHRPDGGTAAQCGAQPGGEEAREGRDRQEAQARVTRLRHSDPAGPGYRRLTSRKGPRYVDEAGNPIVDERELERIRSLVIPPAWVDVWICADANGHIQAVGTDQAGRRQDRKSTRLNSSH